MPVHLNSRSAPGVAPIDRFERSAHTGSRRRGAIPGRGARGALRALAFAAALGAGPAVAYDFVGAERCQTCHEEAYAAWRASKHALAQEPLTAVQRRDPRCTSCHAPNEATERIGGVSCEACHGGGQYYAVSHVMKDPELSRMAGLVDPSERGCRACHDASSPSIRPFDFAAKLSAIDHWSAERKRRGKPPRPAAGGRP